MSEPEPRRRRIAIHAFSISGAGHLQRARRLAEALQPHEILWLGHQPAGAPGTQAPTPIVVAADPPTPADADRLRAAVPALLSWLQDRRPDVVVTEHFPFGNHILADGLLPLLDAGKRAGIPLVASVRDVIGKQNMHPSWAERTTYALNTFYDGVLWHGDDRFLPFDFAGTGPLRPALWPTGYVGPTGAPARSPQPRHWVASCGSGTRGGLTFCETVLTAQRRLAGDGWNLTLVGPADAAARASETVGLPDRTTLLSWCEDLSALLATASVSVSQCGYNTWLEVLASGVPALFAPFETDRDVEQRIRAEATARFPGYACLAKAEPGKADAFAEAIKALESQTTQPPAVQTDGARASARVLTGLSR